LCDKPLDQFGIVKPSSFVNPAFVFNSAVLAQGRLHHIFWLRLPHAGFSIIAGTFQLRIMELLGQVNGLKPWPRAFVPLLDIYCNHAHPLLLLLSMSELARCEQLSNVLNTIAFAFQLLGVISNGEHRTWILRLNLQHLLPQFLLM
jgi:hypothetical protein